MSETVRVQIKTESAVPALHVRLNFDYLRPEILIFDFQKSIEERDEFFPPNSSITSSNRAAKAESNQIGQIRQDSSWNRTLRVLEF